MPYNAVNMLLGNLKFYFLNISFLNHCELQADKKGSLKKSFFVTTHRLLAPRSQHWGGEEGPGYY